MKTCTSCKETKNASEFYNQTASKDGLHPYCKLCSATRNARNYQAKREYYRDRGNATNRRLYQENKEKKLAQNAIWAAENKDRVKAIQKRYAQRHPEQSTLKHSRRRARKLQNGVFTVTAKDVRRILQKPCIYCGEQAEHLDHIIPVSRGGRH